MRLIWRTMLVGALLIEPGHAQAAGPLLVLARQTMIFTPGDRSRPLFRPVPSRRSAAVPARRTPLGRFVRGGPHEERSDEPATSAPPGSGFKMEDGVLTYPAPARFQPKNLKIQ